MGRQLRGGAVIALSEDHKPETRSERARIEKAGGHVSQDRSVYSILYL